MTHAPLITTDTASCSCRKMPGIMRWPEEPIGKFTVRAHEQFTKHMESVKPGEQRGLFTEQLELMS